jgi:hypothetical protein
MPTTLGTSPRRQIRASMPVEYHPGAIVSAWASAIVLSAQAPILGEELAGSGGRVVKFGSFCLKAASGPLTLTEFGWRRGMQVHLRT